MLLSPPSPPPPHIFDNTYLSLASRLCASSASVTAAAACAPARPCAGEGFGTGFAATGAALPATPNPSCRLATTGVPLKPPFRCAPSATTGVGGTSLAPGAPLALELTTAPDKVVQANRGWRIYASGIQARGAHRMSRLHFHYPPPPSTTPLRETRCVPALGRP